MRSHDDEALRGFVTDRYTSLRRSAFLMCGDWNLADELTQGALALLVSESRRGEVDDPDAQLYADLMAAFQRRPGRREHVFVAAPDSAATDPMRTILVLDALNQLSPRSRAVLVLRHWDGFEVDETADIMDLSEERVRDDEATGLAVLRPLLTAPDADAGRGTGEDARAGDAGAGDAGAGDAGAGDAGAGCAQVGDARAQNAEPVGRPTDADPGHSGDDAGGHADAAYAHQGRGEGVGHAPAGGGGLGAAEGGHHAGHMTAAARPTAVGRAAAPQPAAPQPAAHAVKSTHGSADLAAARADAEARTAAVRAAEAAAARAAAAAVVAEAAAARAAGASDVAAGLAEVGIAVQAAEAAARAAAEAAAAARAAGATHAVTHANGHSVPAVMPR